MNQPIEKFMENTRQIVVTFGDSVGVAWNTKEVKEKIVIDGKEWERTAHQKTGDPYIVFIWVRENKDGTYWCDEDSPVNGGFDFTCGRQIANDLLRACAWLEDAQASGKV